VERGDVGSLASYDIMTRFSLRLSYRWADAIWYKEPYMKLLLEKFSNKPLFFIHNAVPESECQNIDVSSRSLDLLWANRDVPQREFGWVVKLSKELEPSFSKALFVGVNSTESLLVKEKVEIRKYIDMSGIFERAKFFLLPSSIAFGNFALLEAMSKGTIPIVTECEGIGLLIEDGVNGFVSNYEYNAYVTCVNKALQLNQEEYSLMSRAAQKTITDNFSVSKWAQKLHVMYAAVSAQN
jgi:glycosyltransferase involved in cell wall biosynthesis